MSTKIDWKPRSVPWAVFTGIFAVSSFIDVIRGNPSGWIFLALNAGFFAYWIMPEDDA